MLPLRRGNANRRAGNRLAYWDECLRIFGFPARRKRDYGWGRIRAPRRAGCPGRAGALSSTSCAASWFETREDALLTMGDCDLILRSIAKRCVSKDGATN